MQKAAPGRSFTIFIIVLGILGTAVAVYRLYQSIVNGDQFRIFVSGALLLFFTVFTINRYIVLRRLQRPNKHTDDSEPMI